MIINMAGGLVAIEYTLKGINYGTVSACASSNHAIGVSLRHIQCGDADVIITGGSESAITPVGLAGFCSAKALSSRNGDPQKASRPFDKNRDGFVMGEGSGIMVLEEMGQALQRNARIYAEIVGYGLTGDAYHITSPAPGGEGAVRCMNMALRDAEADPTAVDYINAHGTATKYGDELETNAIKTVFGEHAYKLVVSSTKSMTGHLLGAAGGVEAVVSVLSIDKALIPPTINLDNPDPECDLDYAPHKARELEVKMSLSNSFGFGGTNACLLFKKIQN